MQQQQRLASTGGAEYGDDSVFSSPVAPTFPDTLPAKRPKQQQQQLQAQHQLVANTFSAMSPSHSVTTGDAMSPASVLSAQTHDSAALSPATQATTPVRSRKTTTTSAPTSAAAAAAAASSSFASGGKRGGKSGGKRNGTRCGKRGGKGLCNTCA